VDLTTEKELLGFIKDISYDYKKQPALGLQAIRILMKGKQSEEDYRTVWLKWREQKGLKEIAHEV